MLVDKDAHQRETITRWPIWLALIFVLIDKFSKNREEEEEEENEQHYTLQKQVLIY